VLLYDRRGPDRIGMRLVNADGSEAEVSGNGLRCLAAWAVRQALAPVDHVIETGAGPRPVRVALLGPGRYRIATDLGAPQAVGLDLPLEAAGRLLRVSAISMGNPHCAVFVDAPPDDATLLALGPAIERHPRFPHRTNVEFVCVESRDAIRVRFWERGAGHTRSSGTGSAAAAAAAILHGRAERRLLVHCEGGTLSVEWPEGGTLRQTGEVELVAEGEWLPS
jgi:diaminopimelate epimerase